MIRTSVIALLAAAALSVPASARQDAVARFSARSVQMASAGRPLFARVDINITQWSSDLDHRHLARTILEQGPVAFSHTLAGYPSLGTIVVGQREFVIRYAWQAPDQAGAQRVYVASSEPIVLTTSEFQKSVDPEPLVFLELRLNARGDGMGKLSDAVRLSVDESRNVIELRDWDHRPLQLVMVHDELNLYD